MFNTSLSQLEQIIQFLQVKAEGNSLRSKDLPRLINNIAIDSLLLVFKIKGEQIKQKIVFKACEKETF